MTTYGVVAWETVEKAPRWSDVNAMLVALIGPLQEKRGTCCGGSQVSESFSTAS
jgi:hypothetical protein